MQVFISWSGEKSHKVAVALRDWLPCVLQGAEPFVSSQDIYAGGRWQNEIAAHLEASHFGIVCVTRDNQDAPWLNFEVGALAKVVQIGRVVPLAIDLNPADVRQPMGQFQAKPTSQAGVGEMIASLNEASNPSLATAIIEKSFEKWWPDLSKRLAEIEEAHATVASPVPTRSDRELLEEVLNTIRATSRFATRNLSDFIASVVLEHTDGYRTKLGDDTITISTEEPLPLRARRMIIARANAEGLRAVYLVEQRAQVLTEAEGQQVGDGDAPEPA
jgi:hypothetical protein